MSAASISIVTSRSLISVGTRARLMTANAWRAPCEAQKANGCAIGNQLLKLSKGRCRGIYSEQNEAANLAKD